MSAVICASSVLCAGGRGTEQVWATVRSGMACIENSHVNDREFDAIYMGLVPEKELPPLPESLEAAVLPAVARRLLRLAGPPLASLSAQAGGSMTVFMGLPEAAGPAPAEPPTWTQDFLAHLRTGFPELPVDPESSRVFAAGRAATFLALEAALEAIEADPARAIVVGGVDSYLDLRKLLALSTDQRILGPRTADGFIPGEGCGFLLLKKSADPGRPGADNPVTVLGAAHALDPGHRHGSEPNRGEGLAQALELLRQRVPDGTAAPIATTFAGFNGENFEAKLWGVARLRHGDLFAADMDLQHPADAIGDTGAASGAILTALAAHALAKGHRRSSALAWAASDGEPRGCAWLSM